MSFDFSTLITDRTQADLDALGSLLSVPMEDWTDEQLAEFNQAASKGAYNASDLNRVTACVDYLAGVFQGLGYAVPGYRKIMVPHAVSRLPEGYTELEYIQSSGTQYIDTGFKPNQDTRVVMDCDLSEEANIMSAFGAWNSGISGAFVHAGRADNQSCAFFYGTSNLTIPISKAGRHLIDFNKNTAKIDSVSITAEAQTFSSNFNLLLFAYANGTSGQTNLSTGKLYSCQVYDNGILILDFVPCTDPSGEVGIYDLVNDQFYENAGTGFFTAGPEIPRLPAMDPYTWYDTDVPTASQMAQYLANVQALQDVITGAYTVSLPSSMALLTYVGANNIEQLLAEINAYLTALQAVFLRSGMTWVVSGGPGFYFSN